MDGAPAALSSSPVNLDNEHSQDHPKKEPEDEITQSLNPVAFREEDDEDGVSQSASGTESESLSGSEEVIVIDKPASLWCPVTGYPHSGLVNFGLYYCQHCHQQLHQIRTTAHVVHPEVNLNIPRAPHELASLERRVSASKSGPKITYLVQFLNLSHHVIETTPWEEAFELAKARGGVSTDSTLFSVMTVVRTSEPDDHNRGPYHPGFHRKALTNPSIFMSIHSTTITIHSQAIIHALNDVVSYYPQVNLDRPSVELQEPYTLLAHHLEELEKYTPMSGRYEQDESSDMQSNGNVSPLERLLNFAKEFVFKGQIEDEKKRYTNTPASCTFRMLWLLFKPGTTVYVEEDRKLGAHVVQAVHVDPAILSSPTKKLSPLVLDLWHLDFDGQCVGRCSTTVTIPGFDGERAIVSLNAFPCEFLDRLNGGETRMRLEENGKRWFELLKVGLVHYTGKFLDEERRFFDGRVVIDNASYWDRIALDEAPIVGEVNDLGISLDNSDDDYPYRPSAQSIRRGPPRPPPPLPRYNGLRPTGLPQHRPRIPTAGVSHCSCDKCRGLRPHPPPSFRWTDYDAIDPKVVTSLETSGGTEPPLHRYLLCSRVLKGLVLKSRQWETLDVELCHPPKRNVMAIDNLVMPEDRKTMIKALVNRFTNPKTIGGPLRQWAADWIENKGEGQIFLLHGSPGVGKTFTAECIAEFTERPLLSLTCGDIGTDELAAESRLSRWFELAERWGAVMLLDEADVFLEKRQLTDLKRNSLVSVFLRAVEYYRGILFLTTNRVGHFDDAFMSRIHVIIAYDNLKEKERGQIWKQFFQKLADERKDIYIDGRAKRYVLEDPDIRDLNWNGREIRNAFQTAVALAEYRFGASKNKQEGDMITLEQADFEKVCDMTTSFKTYLTSVHGGDESTRAYLSRARLDRDVN